VSGGLIETGAELGGDGIPAQCQLQALGHRALAGSVHSLGDGERVTNRVCDQ
jgi:hypothetical protein